MPSSYFRRHRTPSSRNKSVCAAALAERDVLLLICAGVNRTSLTRFAWLSIGAAIVTIGLKTGACLITNSVGLLSDAVESLVNLVCGIMALAMSKIAARPADEDHAYGHSKAEYFSRGVEGSLILVAAISIGVAAVPRLMHSLYVHQTGGKATSHSSLG